MIGWLLAPVCSVGTSHLQHTPSEPSGGTAGQSQHEAPRGNCDHAARPQWLFGDRICGTRLLPSVHSAVARLSCVSPGHAGTLIGPAAACIVDSSTRVGKRSGANTLRAAQ